MEGGITRKSKKCSQILLQGSFLFKELETKFRNSSIMGLAATEATPDDVNTKTSKYRKMATEILHENNGYGEKL